MAIPSHFKEGGIIEGWRDGGEGGNYEGGGGMGLQENVLVPVIFLHC